MGIYKSSLLLIGAITLGLLLALPRVAPAGTPNSSYSSVSAGTGKWDGFVPETELSVTGGYRTDDLDWNIAGDINGNNPNIISELTWDDLESYQLKFQGRLIWPNLVAIKEPAISR